MLNITPVARHRIEMPRDIRLRLNRLEKPEPWTPDQLAEITERAVMPAIARLQQYPAYPAFYDQLAAHLGVSVNGLVVGAGIEEFIRTLFMLNAGGRVACLWPTCAMFEVYAHVFNVDLVKINTIQPRMGIDELVERLREQGKLDLVLLVNPGQPVDTFFDQDELAEIAEECQRRGIWLAIDEAYHGFIDPYFYWPCSSLSLTDHFPNVTVLRSFSKSFGAASLRLGYAYSSPVVHQVLNSVRQSGEVSSVSMAVGSLLLDNYATWIEPWRSRVRYARNSTVGRINDWIKHQGRHGLLRAYGLYANHILINAVTREREKAIYDGLLREGVLVRANIPAPLEGHLLVTCGELQTMHAFQDAFFKVISDVRI